MAQRFVKFVDIEKKTMHKSERKFANLLTRQNRQWEYPAKRFKVSPYTTYRPDFFLPNENLYVEVVGTRQAYHANRDKINAFKEQYKDIRFIIVDIKGNPFPRKQICKEYEVRPKCKKCKSGQVYILKNGTIVCRRCGYRTKISTKP